MLQVWGRRSSFNVQKVMWLIGELGLAHQHIPAGGQYGIKDSLEFLTMNPMAECPSLKIAMGQWYGSRTVSSGISRRVIGNRVSGVMIQLCGLKLTVGWIGLKPACNRLF
jgi:hypothetical protein